MNSGIIHFTPSALFAGLSSNPDRKYSSSNHGNPKNKPSAHRVRKLLWKRSIGLSVKASSISAGWQSDGPARRMFADLGLSIDIPRSAAEVRASAVAAYVAGERITSIAKRYHFGTTTIWRWVVEAGADLPFSQRKAKFSAESPVGSMRIGKKGLIQTTKGGAWIPTDSTYEFARVRQLEEDGGVVVIRRCAESIPYQCDGAERRYIPDFEVTLSDGSIRVEEVKPLRWVDDPVVVLKADAARLWFGARGMKYVLVSESDIGAERIAECSLEGQSRQSPEYAAYMRERRLAQRRSAAKTYNTKMKSKGSLTAKS